MSGLSAEPRTGNGRFVNFKKGNLVNNGTTFFTLTGHIIDLDISDQSYNKKDYRRVTLFVKDDADTVYLLTFPLASGYGNSFFRMCPNIDYALPVTISGGTEKMESGHEYGKMFIQQSGAYVKHFYTKDSKEGKKVPVPSDIKHKGTVIGKDYTDRDTFIEKVLAGLLEKKIKKAFPKGATGKDIEMSQKKNDYVPASDGSGDRHQDTEIIDDLPF